MRALSRSTHNDERSTYSDLSFTHNDYESSTDSQLHPLEQALGHWIEFVESQDWGYGSGGGEGSDTISGRFAQGTLGEADRERACQWLDSQLGFACIRSAELSNAWH